MKLTFLLLGVLGISYSIVCSDRSLSRQDFATKGSLARILVPQPKSYQGKKSSRKVDVTLFGKTYTAQEECQGDCIVTTAFDEQGYTALFIHNVVTGYKTFRYNNPHVRYSDT